jgi:hypothetical protein
MAITIYRKLAAGLAAVIASGVAASCTTPAGRPTVVENPTIDRAQKASGADRGPAASSARGGGRASSGY